MHTGEDGSTYLPGNGRRISWDDISHLFVRIYFFHSILCFIYLFQGPGRSVCTRRLSFRFTNSVPAFWCKLRVVHRPRIYRFYYLYLARPSTSERARVANSIPRLSFESAFPNISFQQQGLDSASALHCELSLIYIYIASQNYFSCRYHFISSRCRFSTNVSLSAETLMVCPYFYSSTHVLISYSTSGSIRWKGRSSYRELSLYDARIFLPSMSIIIMSNPLQAADTRTLDGSTLRPKRRYHDLIQLE